MGQMRRGEISIYDRSGVFSEFEDRFVAYHGGGLHALVQNSGTSALWSMFVGAQLGKGDEVIVPSYSFYASYSPLMWTGATPVFADSGSDGNIDVEDIEERITPRTKAVLVTHMWGVPCDMPRIVELCKRRGLLLFEDCSHAHGARIAGQLVGTFGDGAAWSLQGQKIITGGEGGIMLTRNSWLIDGATLLGQYNKRAKQQLGKSHRLEPYALTGMGLKLRAHPFAIAMAMEQFAHLDTWLAQKRKNAAAMSEALSEFPFIIPPAFQGEPAWYAFVFQYDATMAGVSDTIFERALLRERLVELDRPSSTRPNHDLALFTQPQLVLPQLYARDWKPVPGDYPGADRFYRQAFKLPVWAFPDEERIVQSYIDGLVKVCRAVQTDPAQFAEV